MVNFVQGNLVMALLVAATGALADGKLRVMVVGGGPEPAYNQVAIENNVRYLQRLLPPGTKQTVLFADGDARGRTVAYQLEAARVSQAKRLTTLILGRGEDDEESIQFRSPSLAKIDGPAKRSNLADTINQIAREPGSSANHLLMYFTGHGSPGKSRDEFNNNNFNLWGEDLTVRELADRISALPSNQPLTLVMVQCYSGAFGNLIFEGGDPARPATDRDIAGFFASVSDRPAAGCTPAVNEADYRDFSTFFFAALSGQDRLGRRVTGADFDGDGRISLHEGFCYTLINDDSIDVPVCTSDVFLRMVLKTPETTVFSEPYENVLRWADVAQKAALEKLSAKLELSGSDRGRTAYERVQRDYQGGLRNGSNGARRKFMQTASNVRNELLDKWPALKDRKSANAAARAEATAEIDRRLAAGQLQDIVNAVKDLDKAEKNAEDVGIDDALRLRFARLFKTVYLTHELRTSDHDMDKKRFERLMVAENRSLQLKPQATAQRANTNLTATCSTNRLALGSPIIK